MFNKLGIYFILLSLFFLFPHSSYAVFGTCSFSDKLSPDGRINSQSTTTVKDGDNITPITIYTQGIEPGKNYKIKFNNGQNNQFVKEVSKLQSIRINLSGKPNNLGDLKAKLEGNSSPNSIGKIYFGKINAEALQDNDENLRYDRTPGRLSTATRKFIGGERYSITIWQDFDSKAQVCTDSNLSIIVDTPRSGGDECSIDIPYNHPPATSIATNTQPLQQDALLYSENIKLKVSWKPGNDNGSEHMTVIKTKRNPYDLEGKVISRFCADTKSLTDYSIPSPDGTDNSDQHPVNIPDLWPGFYTAEVYEKCNRDKFNTNSIVSGGKVICFNTFQVEETSGGGEINIPLSTISPLPVCPNDICNTALGKVNASDPVKFISFLFSYILSFAGIIAFLILILAGYRLMTSAGDKQKVAGARETITSAIIGLLVIIFSLVIFQLIGVDLLQLPGLTP